MSTTNVTRNYDLKFHEDISSGINPIYRIKLAKRHYREKRYTYRQLTTWQQENIRHALLDCKHRLRVFKDAVSGPGGLCFKFKCEKCPIQQKLKNKCDEIPEWFRMRDARSFKSFAEAHEIWCKTIGNYHWRKLWEEYPFALSKIRKRNSPPYYEGLGWTPLFGQARRANKL